MEEEEFEMQEVAELTQNLSFTCEVKQHPSKTECDVFAMSEVLLVISDIETDCVKPTPIKRHV